MPGIAPISRDALGIWGVDAAGEATVGAVCASFVRVSPVNLVFAGLMRRLLGGERPQGVRGGRAARGRRRPRCRPARHGRSRALSPAEGGVLMSLATTMDGAPFVPGLYRMLAQWPPLLAHLATVLQPHLDDPRTAAALRDVNAAIDAEIPALFAALPPVPAAAALPSSDGFAGVLAALDTYRKTSPEMVVFGRMIGRALPARTGAHCFVACLARVSVQPRDQIVCGAHDGPALRRTRSERSAALHRAFVTRRHGPRGADSTVRGDRGTIPVPSLS